MITLSASTLGAPGADLDQVLSWLESSGIHGLELRLHHGELADVNQSKAERRQLRARIREAGIQVTGVASYVPVCGQGEDSRVIADLMAAVDFAADIGSPLLRVLPGAAMGAGPYNQAPVLLEPKEEADTRAVNRLNTIGNYAAGKGVLPALETHDSHPTGADISRILTRVDQPVGAIWDIMHPWRVGESLNQTWQALKPWLETGHGCVQIKDAALPGNTTPLPIGQGTLPTAQFAELLTHNGYSGTITLEWEKAWHPDALPLPDALKSAKQWKGMHWPAQLASSRPANPPSGRPKLLTVRA